MNEPYIGGEIIKVRREFFSLISAQNVLQFKGVIDVGCTREVRIGGLLVRLTGVAETGWRNKNSDLSFESRHNFMDELIDLTTLAIFLLFNFSLICAFTLHLLSGIL